MVAAKPDTVGDFPTVLRNASAKALILLDDLQIVNAGFLTIIHGLVLSCRRYLVPKYQMNEFTSAVRPIDEV